jgi:hypothetical protein
VFRRLEKTEGSGKEYGRLWNAHRKDFLARSGTPDAVAGPDGVVVTDPVEVLRIWREYGLALGRQQPISRDAHDRGEGAPSGVTYFDDVFARRVLQRVAELSRVDGGIPELDKEVSWEEVHEEVRRLEGGKAAGLDEIVPELIKMSGRATEEALVLLFNHAWRSLEWPSDWQRAYFMPLFKGDGSQLDPDNYRLLAISSVVSKLFEKILYRRIQA